MKAPPPLRKLAVLASATALRLRAAAAFVPPSLPSARLPRPPPPPSHRCQAAPPRPRRSSSPPLRARTTTGAGGDGGDDDGPGCWNPGMRRKLAVLSSAGLLETSYLAYEKVQYSSGSGGAKSLVGALCSAGESGASSCSDVLHGPYASLQLGGADVPLAAAGAAAYGAVLLLAAAPLLSSDSNEAGEGEGRVLDGDNRVVLLGATTLMASFSIYLVSLLLGVLHESCAFCFVSAGLSVSLAALSWTGGMLPEAAGGDELATTARKNGVLAGASSVGAATVAALVLFLGAGDVGGDLGGPGSFAASASPSTSPPSGGILLASTASVPPKPSAANVPPRITTRSTPYALSLASDLKSLDARMYGAFWCSHCYDQKQSLGAEAMRSIPYVECDAEGYNNQRKTCKEKEVPGYPTWEIGGELFPGERSLEELREIVDDVKANR